MVIGVRWAVWVTLLERTLKLYLSCACSGLEAEKGGGGSSWEQLPSSTERLMLIQKYPPESSNSVLTAAFQLSCPVTPASYLPCWPRGRLSILYFQKAKSKGHLLWPGPSAHCYSAMWRRLILFSKSTLPSNESPGKRGMNPYHPLCTLQCVPLSELACTRALGWSMVLVSLLFPPSSTGLFSHPRRQLCWGVSHLLLCDLATGVTPPRGTLLLINGPKEALLSRDSFKLKACAGLYHKWQSLISIPLTKELKEVTHMNTSSHGIWFV